MNQPLNKTEVDQPAPLEVQREHLQNELMRLDRLIAEKREQIRRITQDGRRS